jgi:pyridoxal phosphate enzyme (YggS family)
MHDDMSMLRDRVAGIRQRIALACQRAGRDDATVRLIAVTKTHDAATVAGVLNAGVTDVGENRVQEAEAKIEALAAAQPGATWHLIGHLQRNKARRAALLFAVIQSIDSVELAAAVARHAHAAGRTLDILLQVNVSGEASKEGFDLQHWRSDPAQLAAFIDAARDIAALAGTRITGLMTIAPLAVDAEQARPVFRALRALRDTLRVQAPEICWDELSMGMTDDFEVAIEEGATMVRIGRALFGARPAPHA